MTARAASLGLLVAALAAAPGRAQAPPASPSPAAPALPPPSPGDSPCDYRVGPGDILEVDVLGNEDLSRTPTVQTSGVIALPLLGEVAVTGLSPSEIQRKLVQMLGKDYLVNPQVEVKVKEFHSQFVTVIGEVNNPGRKPLRGCTRLVEVLVEAGGFSSRASGEVAITRREGTFDGGETTLRIRLTGSTIAMEQANPPLRNGDMITSSPKYYVTVEGEVSRPGRYPIEGELTASGAVSIAGGLTRFGSSDIKVRRVDPKTGQTRILDVDLKAIRGGKKPDLALLPNDVVSVTRKLF